ncbi:MAG: GNAT family N-acetyltransferase [Chitinophagales bacterium]|nr:GNAT family N-acetyltransferase [Chitinophagales bacterium]
MITIKQISAIDLESLAALSKSTFVQSHGHSADSKDIDTYLRYAYSLNRLRSELEDKNTYFHFLYDENILVGYSKISLETNYPKVFDQPLAKLDRIYIDEKSLDKKLGQVLFDFNLEIAKQNNQKGIWLYTWIENHRAIKFYQKNGFEIIDHKDFKISNRHSNPNYIMYKKNIMS